VPVIVLSNLGQDSDVAKAKKMGAKDYLVKSNVSIAEVVAMVKKYVG
jgi:DNA-binding response OmpR family regulator